MLFGWTDADERDIFGIQAICPRCLLVQCLVFLVHLSCYSPPPPFSRLGLVAPADRILFSVACSAFSVWLGFYFW